MSRTKGTWRVIPGENCPAAILSEDGLWVCELSPRNNPDDALLIAASPDLLKALQEMVEDFRDWENFKEDDLFRLLRRSANKAEAAIAKATGNPVG